jgi:hypothetical protein
MADEITTDTGSSDDAIKSLLRTSMGDVSGFKLPTPPKMRTGEELKKDYESYGKDISAYKKAEAEAGVRKAEIEATSARELAARYEPQLQRTPDFVPSEENKAALVGLFGLIGAIGAFGGGKSYGSAVGAMNAMGGMLKGYSQGRKDLFEREKAEFEKQMTAVKAHNDEIMKAYARAKDLAKTDLGLAQAKLVSELTGLGAKVQANEVKEKGIVAGEEANMKAYNAAKQQYDSYVKALGAMMTKGKGAAAGTTQGGAVQFRYNQAVANASYQAAIEVENFASMPLKSAPPAANAVLTDPSKSLTDATVSYFAAKNTEADSRAVQQVTAGLNRSIAAIAASGRPGGITEAAIKEFAKMAPTAGDKKINTFLYMAMIRQEFDVAVKDLIAAGADPKQIELAKEARDKAYSAIPFSVQDVTRILRGGGPALVNDKTKELLATSDRLKGFEASIDKVIKSGGGAVPQAAPVAPAAAPAPAPAAPAQESESKKKARAAIAAGAPREAVIKRLQDAGEDVSGL